MSVNEYEGLSERQGSGMFPAANGASDNPPRSRDILRGKPEHSNGGHQEDISEISCLSQVVMGISIYAAIPSAFWSVSEAQSVHAKGTAHCHSNGKCAKGSTSP